MRAATVVLVLQHLFYVLLHVLFYLWSLLNTCEPVKLPLTLLLLLHCVQKKITHSSFVLYLRGKCLDLYKIFRICLRGNTYSMDIKIKYSLLPVTSFWRRPVERGGKFSRDPRRLGAPPSLKNTEKCVPDVFFLIWKMHKIHFWTGLHPDPARGAYDAPPDP